MTDTPQDKPLPEVLYPYHRPTCQAVFYQNKTCDCGLLAAFERSMLEVIGGDEFNSSDVSFADDLQDIAFRCRNKLRAQQRKALQTLLKQGRE